ncbi:serine/threonine protein kinase [Stieleria sp. JC731]|uniref:serine/threonine-protein kinase n=1 Tax=Pirellulaceae TaxID=2691357 RepID=UPI001E465FEB|nr:serine/threonine-protein kinase [Stieleria sp. JC731]MCC9602154.1 serine/threonine protein kinase [Stieleria sp. JC731]
MEDPQTDDCLDAPTAQGLDAPTDIGSPACDLDSPTPTPARGQGTHSHPTPISGQVIDDYEIVREIARGGMGVVYLAKQQQLNRFVALKMILESSTASAAELGRFENEAKAAGALDHPGIVPVYEVGSFEGCPYFSMGYVDGKSLASVLSEGPFAPKRAAELAKAVALAVGHAHDQQIIHRDIKPANILIDRDGNPRLTDFGVCKLMAGQSQLTTHGELIGTPHYMPPEQAGTPDAMIGPTSDIYSIGAVLYAMLTDRPPFLAPSPIDVITQVMTKDPVPPSQFFSGIPQDLETITLKCLAKAPKDRYQSATQLAEELSRFLDDEPILAKPPGLGKRLTHWIRRHVLLASVSGSMAFLLVFLLLLLGIALAQSQAKIARLQNLLEVERNGARRFTSTRFDSDSSRHQFDVERLTDAAIEFVDEDRQLSLHLSVHAAELAIEHRLAFPERLTNFLMQLAAKDSATANSAIANEELLVEQARKQITRELTDFEQKVYGLLDRPTVPIEQNESNTTTTSNEAS